VERMWLQYMKYKDRGNGMAIGNEADVEISTCELAPNVECDRII
jgi:hypothetical protein